MKKILKSDIISTGLATFSMFFGAGNLLYPLQVGIVSGTSNWLGIIAFLITAALMPLAGLIALILFDGDYTSFFQRLGKIPGNFLIASCVLILGPLIVIPRIVTLSHTMVGPFLPTMSPFVFSILFLGLTFLLSFRESKIMIVLGYIISPALLISLGIIIIKGLFMAHDTPPASLPNLPLFFKTLRIGYETVDLISAIFLSTMMITLLKKNFGATTENNVHSLALLGMKAGILGLSLLGIIYVGMSYISAFHGVGLPATSGILFSTLSFKILGSQWASIIAIAVSMACLSTAIAMGALTAEYFENGLFKNKLHYIPCLALALIASVPLSNRGLDAILSYTGGPITYIGYPVIIVLTFCNIAYKLFDFKPVKIPVFVTFIASLISYLW